jgi:hypothetical protein
MNVSSKLVFIPGRAHHSQFSIGQIIEAGNIIYIPCLMRYTPSVLQRNSVHHGVHQFSGLLLLFLPDVKFFA